jgi:hypothetical protein
MWFTFGKSSCHQLSPISDDNVYGRPDIMRKIYFLSCPALKVLLNIFYFSKLLFSMQEKNFKKLKYNHY